MTIDPYGERGVSRAITVAWNVKKHIPATQRSLLPGGHQQWSFGMNLRSLAVLLCVIIGLPISHIDAKADGPHVDAGVGNLTQDATRWSSELGGGQWGWRLTKYNVITGAYKIDGQTLLSLSATATDSVLWNPLTGKGRHLNQDEWKRINIMHEKERIQTWMNPIRLQEGRMLKTRGWALHCQAIPFKYYEIINSNNIAYRASYIVRKLEQKERIKYFTCPEADTMQEHYMDINWLMDIDFVAELSDGTFLFSNSGYTPTFESPSKPPIIRLLIRLDGTLKQHTTLGGLILVIDAAEINGDFKPGDDDFDMYNSFTKLFLKQLEGTQVIETP